MGSSQKSGLNRTFVRFNEFKAHVRLTSVAHYSDMLLPKKFECPMVELGCEVGCRAAWLYAVKQKIMACRNRKSCAFFCYKFIPDSDCGKQKCISEAERECKYAIVVPCKLIVAPPSQMADVITINNFSIFQKDLPA